MDGSSSTGSDEQRRKRELIALVDGIHESPELRARKVLEILRANEAVTTWDVACFCAEYLGMMSAVWPWLGDASKRVAQLIYTAHYEHFGAELPEEAKRSL